MICLEELRRNLKSGGTVEASGTIAATASTAMNATTGGGTPAVGGSKGELGDWLSFCMLVVWWKEWYN